MIPAVPPVNNHEQVPWAAPGTIIIPVSHCHSLRVTQPLKDPPPEMSVMVSSEKLELQTTLLAL